MNRAEVGRIGLEQAEQLYGEWFERVGIVAEQHRVGEQAVRQQIGECSVRAVLVAVGR